MGPRFAFSVELRIVVNGKRTRNAIDGVDVEVEQRVERALPHLRFGGERKTCGPSLFA